jgi:hypothetical protein
MISKYKRKEVTIMQEVIREYLEMAKVGRKQVYKNMAVFPLLSDYSLVSDYILLDEALSTGMIEVTEVSEHGAVPNLKIHNKSPRMVLILDGEELVGAKQNRIVNTTILIAGNATVVIPVSCVEQGRWSYATPRFYSEERIMPSRLRSRFGRQGRAHVHLCTRSKRSGKDADFMDGKVFPKKQESGISLKYIPLLSLTTRIRGEGAKVHRHGSR